MSGYDPESLPDPTHLSTGANGLPAEVKWDCLYGLPNQRYLEFVDEALLLEVEHPRQDPFAIDPPEKLVVNCYIRREEVEAEVLRPGSQIILGQPGVGKSTLCAALLRTRDISSHAYLKQAGGDSHRSEQEHPSGIILTVGVPLTELTTGGSAEVMLTGGTGPLSLQHLIPQVFDTYWDKAIRDEYRRAIYLRDRRVDRALMELFRWFYQRYPPSHPQVDDHELMAWLSSTTPAPPLSEGLSHLKTFSELLQLISWKVNPKLYPQVPESKSAYRSVEAVLDGARQLSAPAVRRLLADVQGLSDMGLDSFHIKLFLDDSWRPQVTAAGSVREGRIAVIHLPRWSESELRSLLRTRLLSFRKGGFSEDPKKLPEWDLGRLLHHAGAVEASARKKVEARIIAGARGRPLHALRLARSVVAAAANCWPDTFKPPLSRGDIKALVAGCRRALDGN